MKTCSDFAELFFERLNNIAGQCNKVRLILGRFFLFTQKETESRTPSKTLNRRTKRKSRITCQHISLKDLSNVKTKDEFEEYLSKKSFFLKTQPDSLRKFLVTSGTTTKGDTEILEIVCAYGHEELTHYCYLMHSQ